MFEKASMSFLARVTVKFNNFLDMISDSVVYIDTFYVRSDDGSITCYEKAYYPSARKPVKFRVVKRLGQKEEEDTPITVESYMNVKTMQLFLVETRKKRYSAKVGKENYIFDIYECPSFYGESFIHLLASPDGSNVSKDTLDASLRLMFGSLDLIDITGDALYDDYNIAFCRSIRGRYGDS